MQNKTVFLTPAPLQYSRPVGQYQGDAICCTVEVLEDTVLIPKPTVPAAAREASVAVSAQRDGSDARNGTLHSNPARLCRRPSQCPARIGLTRAHAGLCGTRCVARCVTVAATAGQPGGGAGRGVGLGLEAGREGVAPWC